MKNAFILLQFIIMPTFVSGQSYGYLNEFTTCSSQLDSIIKFVQKDVEETDIIDISAKKISDEDYTIYVSAYPSFLLRYSKELLGFMKRNNIIIFDKNTKDLICKKVPNGKRLGLRCNPPPSKEGPLTVICTDGGKEWTYRIKGDSIILERKILAW